MSIGQRPEDLAGNRQAVSSFTADGGTIRGMQTVAIGGNPNRRRRGDAS